MVLQDLFILKIEFAAVVDYGEPFVRGTYNLEGDGPLVFTCYEEVSAIVNAIHVENIPNVQAVADCLSPLPAVRQQLIMYVCKELR